MAAKWVEVQYQGGLTRVAMVKGYSITIVGSQDLWSWFIDLDGCSVTEGVERDPAAAMTAAEDEAHRLAMASGT